ncbi:MAG: hypothetical protein FWH27_16595 [Planctomycetaceae bacterium]|nr:hypothetical protein [Planctomycetaceae bacterium]
MIQCYYSKETRHGCQVGTTLGNWLRWIMVWLVAVADCRNGDTKPGEHTITPSEATIKFANIALLM